MSCLKNVSKRVSRSSDADAMFERKSTAFSAGTCATYAVSLLRDCFRSLFPKPKDAATFYPLRPMTQTQPDPCKHAS